MRGVRISAVTEIQASAASGGISVSSSGAGGQVASELYQRSAVSPLGPWDKLDILNNEEDGLAQDGESDGGREYRV